MSEKKSTSAAGNDDESQALFLEKKKSKVLKQALKDERKQREELKKELEKVKGSNTQLQQQMADKEKKYFELYQEKMMLEETLIRESSTNKLQGRGFGAPTPQNKSSVGPPVTFMNPSQKSPASKDDSSAAEKTVSVGSLQDMMSGND